MAARRCATAPPAAAEGRARALTGPRPSVETADRPVLSRAGRAGPSAGRPAYQRKRGQSTCAASHLGAGAARSHGAAPLSRILRAAARRGAGRAAARRESGWGGMGAGGLAVSSLDTAPPIQTGPLGLGPLGAIRLRSRRSSCTWGGASPTGESAAAHASSSRRNGPGGLRNG